MPHMLLFFFCMYLHMNADFSIKVFKQKKQVLCIVPLPFVQISAFLPFFGLWKQRVEKMSRMNWHWTSVSSLAGVSGEPGRVQVWPCLTVLGSNGSKNNVI